MSSLASCHNPASESAWQPTVRPSVTQIARPANILLIGNSFTFFNSGVDHHLRGLLEAEFPHQTFLIRSHTAPNQTVKGHFRDPSTEQMLRREAWDIVIIQGASYETVEEKSRREFDEYSALLADKIRSYDAGVGLFMTWPYWYRPAMIESLATRYVSTANELSALVIPVGLAWERVREKRTTGFLYSDSKHPSTHGTYLAACVFYATLFGISPVGNTYTASLPDSDARYLQEVATQTTREFFGK